MDKVSEDHRRERRPENLTAPQQAAVEVNVETREGRTTTSLLPSSWKANSGTTTSTINCIPLVSESYEIGTGILRLYREHGHYPDSDKGGVDNFMDTTQLLGSEGNNEDDPLKTVAILAVPSYMAPSDLLGFIGERTVSAVSQFRMIRAAQANRYMVLMRFRERDEAAWFVQQFNGSIFNSMEPENCHCVFVRRIHFSELGGSTSSEIPYTRNTGSGLFSNASLSNKPVAPPTPALTELPTCPVCLERMDDTISGLLTILCQHVFHCACLSKWKDSSCPVCRYTQHSAGSFRYRQIPAPHTGDFLETPRTVGLPIDEDGRFCSSCNADSNLWICLICAKIGCGRYDEAHAYNHFKETAHSYAMDLDTQRIWDYLGDGYVHRLLQSKSDGKLVQLPSSLEEGDTVPIEKIEKIAMEYTFLLSSQLDSQRAYYEEICAKAADKYTALSKICDDLTISLLSANSNLSRLSSSHEKLQFDHDIHTRAEAKLEVRARKLEALARKWQKEAEEEKSMNAGLLERLRLLNEQVKSEREIKMDLQEQVSDLMSFLEARQSLGEGTEGEGGTVVLMKNHANSGPRGSTRLGRKK